MRISFKQAAYRTLKEAGTPLHYREITRLAIENGLIDSSGKTPEATMIAQLGVDVNFKKERSPFVKTSPGCFALNPKMVVMPDDTKEEEKTKTCRQKQRFGRSDNPGEWDEVDEYVRRVCTKEIWDTKDDEAREYLCSELLWAAADLAHRHPKMLSDDPRLFWKYLSMAIRRHTARCMKKFRKRKKMEITPRRGDATLIFDRNLFISSMPANVPEAQARIEAREAVAEAGRRLAQVPTKVIRRKSLHFQNAGKGTVFMVPEDSPFFSSDKYPTGMSSLWGSAADEVLPLSVTIKQEEVKEEDGDDFYFPNGSRLTEVITAP